MKSRTQSVAVAVSILMGLCMSGLMSLPARAQDRNDEQDQNNHCSNVLRWIVPMEKTGAT